jgi:hypothetical protein
MFTIEQLLESGIEVKRLLIQRFEVVSHRSRTIACPEEIVGQSHAMPFCNLEDFMLAVGKESTPLNGVGALGSPVKLDLIASVSYNELATCLPVNGCEAFPGVEHTFVRNWETDDE